MAHQRGQGHAQQLKLLPSELQMSCAERIVSLYLDRTSHHQPQSQQCIYLVDTFRVCAIKQSLSQ